jgi:hypothetical protein
VRPITDAERQRLGAGLRSSDAFVLRRCQILLASARGEIAPQIAHHLGCDSQTVRNAIWAFNHAGLVALRKGSSRPHTTRTAFPGEQAAQLRTLLHQSPRTFDKPKPRPRWIHAKRKVVEANRLLSGRALAQRVCDDFGCAYEEHLALTECKQVKVLG